MTDPPVTAKARKHFLGRYLRPARPGDEADRVQRGILLSRARQQRTEIQEYFDDLAHWNEHVRKPHEAPIDPDPDGVMRQLADDLDEFLIRNQDVPTQ